VSFDWLYYIPRGFFWIVIPAIVGYPAVALVSIVRIKSGQRWNFIRENAGMFWGAALFAMLGAIFSSLLVSAFIVFVWSFFADASIDQNSSFTIWGIVYISIAIGAFIYQLRDCTNEYRHSR
jgi:hypothetical protein